VDAADDTRVDRRDEEVDRPLGDELRRAGQERA